MVNILRLRWDEGVAVGVGFGWMGPMLRENGVVIANDTAVSK